MRIVLLGGPGAGKGTQGDYICEHLGIPKISTGDMLRAAVSAGSRLGREAKEVMDSGELVSDDIILGLVKQRVAQPDCATGFLLDGFPRTIAQAEGLVAVRIKLDQIIEIIVDDEEIVRRMSGRLVHQESGRSYHLKYNPPKEDNVDDVTGEPLVQREDDREATVRKRLEVYQAQTKPLVLWFEKYAAKQPGVSFAKVDGVGTVDSIKSQISKLL